MAKRRSEAAQNSWEKQLLMFKDHRASFRSKMWQLCTLLDHERTRENIKRAIQHEALMAGVDEDNLYTRGMKKIMDSDTHVACKICYAMENTSLSDCLIGCQSNGNIVSHNIGQHYQIKGRNCELHREAYQKAMEKEKTSNRSKSSLLEANGNKRAATISPQKKSLLMDWLKDSPALGQHKKKELIKQIQTNTCQYVIEANLPPRVLQLESLTKLLRVCLRSGDSSTDIEEDDLKFDSRYFPIFLAESLADLIDTLSEAVTRIRSYHTRKSTGNDKTGFIHVGHKIVDAKHKCLIGLSLYFADPVNGDESQVFLGHVAGKGKNAEQVAQETLKLLQLFGITSTDLVQPINETINAAMAGARLLAGGKLNGSYEYVARFMNRSVLAVNLATGFLVREQNQADVNSFEESVNLRKRVREVTNLVGAKENSLYESYTNFCRSMYKCGPISIPLQYRTNISGTAIMYERAIRSCHVLRKFITEVMPIDDMFNNLGLKDHEWKMLAEFTAVFRCVSDFVTAIESNEFGAISFTRIHMVAMLMKLYLPADYDDPIFEPKFEMMSLEVPDVHNEEWGPRVQYDDIPKVRLAYAHDHSSECSAHGYVSDETQELVKRLFQECKSLCTTLTEDEELALLLNPITVIEGIEVLRSTRVLLEDQIMLMESKLVDRVKKYYTSHREQRGDSAGKPRLLPQYKLNSDEEVHVDDIFARRGKRHCTNRASNIENAESLNMSQKIRAEYNDFKTEFSKKSQEDWALLVMEYPTAQMQKEITKEFREMTIAEQNEKSLGGWVTKETRWISIPVNGVYTSTKFSVIRFWKAMEDKYPLLYPVAMTVLSKPPANIKEESLSWLGKLDKDWRTKLPESDIDLRLFTKVNRAFVDGEHKKGAIPLKTTPYADLSDENLATFKKVFGSHRDLSQELLSEGLLPDTAAGDICRARSLGSSIRYAEEELPDDISESFGDDSDTESIWYDDFMGSKSLTNDSESTVA